MSVPVSGAIRSASMRKAVFRPGQREVRLRAAEHGPRQVEALRIAAAGLALDLRPARIAEAEELGDLVEGLADGVVDGRAEANVIADAAHRDELRVPAGGEEEQVGEADAVGEARRQGMALEVVDGEQRLAGDERQRLGGGQPDQDAADQPRTGGRGDAVEIGEAQGRPVHGAPDQPVDHLHMRPRGDLGNDAAIGGVLGDLAEHLV